MNIAELQSYNATNIVLQSNYEALKKSLEKYGSWTKAWQAIRKSLPITLDAEAEWLKLDQHGIKLILQNDASFPKQLQEMPWPPLGLYIKGNDLNQGDKIIAIVGTRKATQQGKTLAKKFAKQLSENSLIIASGLALGIDAAAHEGAVESQAKTIAVLAHGLETIYPRTNEALAKKILATGGSLISEYPLGSPSLPHHFIERNRIVSALSLGVIIIEAPKDSGALATARFAIDQNREIFVVPGPIDNQNYFGSHELIKSGAALITSTEDVLMALNLKPVTGVASLFDNKTRLAELDTLQKTVILCLQEAGQATTIDAIKEITGLETNLISSALSFLVIKNLVKEENGKYYI